MRLRFAWIVAALGLALGACGDDSAAAPDGGVAASGGAGHSGSGGSSAGRSGSGAGGNAAGSGGRGGAAGSGDDDGGTPYSVDPGKTGPKGAVRGKLDGVSGAALSSAVVTAGGVVGSIRASGHFFVDGVPVGADVSVFVRVKGYTTAHARVPVREREVTPLPLFAMKLASEDIADATVAHESTFGGDSVKHKLRWPAGALQSVYGTAASGAVKLSTALFGAKLAPANLTADDAGAKVPLRAFAIVELVIEQPRALLTFTKKATLELQLELGATSTTQALYRFDEWSGVFEKQPGATFDASTLVLTAEIDRAGIYAAGSTGMELGCAAGRLVEAAGTGLPGAAIRFYNPSEEEGGLAWSSADGRYCLPITPAQPIVWSALGLRDGGLVAIDLATSDSSSFAAMCSGMACFNAGQQTAVARPLGCARGRLTKLGVTQAVSVSATKMVDAEVSNGPVVSATTGEPFCIDVTDETSLKVTGPRLNCGAARTLATPKAAASCAENNCVDIGEIGCCSENDTCGDGVDDDCDSKIDEGCVCGSTDCTSAHTKSVLLTNHCCVSGGFCGFRYPTVGPVDHCFAFSAASSYSSNCPSATGITVAGKSMNLNSCCVTDIDQCGLNLDGNCLPRSEFQYLTNMSLTPITCSVP